jgi:hypothetical protein
MKTLCRVFKIKNLRKMDQNKTNDTIWLHQSKLLKHLEDEFLRVTSRQEKFVKLLLPPE